MLPAASIPLSIIIGRKDLHFDILGIYIFKDMSLRSPAN